MLLKLIGYFRFPFPKPGKSEPLPSLTYVDPAMIMILVVMALMFIIICVVLRLFSR